MADGTTFYADGLRAVMILSTEALRLDEIEFLRWAIPPRPPIPRGPLAAPDRRRPAAVGGATRWRRRRASIRRSSPGDPRDAAPPPRLQGPRNAGTAAS